jgi:hypothetical protein
MPGYMVPIIISFCMLSLFQYTIVITKLFEGEYKTKKEFLIALIPGKFMILVRENPNPRGRG